MPPALPSEALGIGEVEDRIPHRTELHPLVAAGQEAASPEAVVERLSSGPLGDHDHECRQVAVLVTQTVGQPGAQTGPPRDLRAGQEKGDGRIVIDGLGMHGPDEAEVVGDLGGPGQELADPGSRLAVLGELVDGRSHGKAALLGGHAGEALTLADGLGQFLAAAGGQGRLVVEQVHLGGASRLEQPDHPLGRGGEVGQGCESGKRSRSGSVSGAPGSLKIFLEQRPQGGGPDSGGGGAEEVAPGLHQSISLPGIHVGVTPW